MQTLQTNHNPPVSYDLPEGTDLGYPIMYPVKDVHTWQEVRDAERWIKKEHGCKKVIIRWTVKGDQSPPPMKLTDDIIIRELKKEIGSLNAYITELEDRLSDKKLEREKEVRKEIKKEDLYKILEKQLAQVKKDNLGLRKNLSELIVKLNQQHNEKLLNSIGNPPIIKLPQSPSNSEGD